MSTAPLRGENRRFDGLQNNASHPTWGAASQNFGRITTSYYADGMSDPAGPTRPNPRTISNALGAQTQSMPDERGLSDFAWQWGQFVDHDITLRRGGHEWMPIVVEDHDDRLAPMIPFMRSAFASGTGDSPQNPRQQISDTTAFLDASMVYGADPARADALRTFTGGRLATDSLGFMPRNELGLANDNEGREPDETLFLAGDPRSNEHVGLTAMHTLFLREHNRLADEFAAQQPGWDDEQIYQRVRKTVGALIQSVTYGEYLPALLGSAAPDPSAATYDTTVNPVISNEFAAAAFRLGHTQVSDELLRVNVDGTMAAGGHVRLQDVFFRPSYFTAADDVDMLLKGMALHIQQQTDLRMPEPLRNAMFGPPGSGGMDLFSINLQRGRDHGLPSYNEALQSLAGMSPADSFADITQDTEIAAALEAVYGDVDHVDLWVGAIAEDALPDSALGPLLEIMVTEQFDRLMRGDRFFYTWDDSFTAAEKDAITDTKLSDIILRNTSIHSIQPNVFFIPEPGSLFAIAWLGFGAVLWRRGFMRRRQG